MVLLDENLDALSLRMYNESEDPGEYSVKVEEAVHAGADKNPFYRRITSLIKPSEDPWKTFSAVVARTVRIRAQNLRARINEQE